MQMAVSLVLYLVSYKSTRVKYILIGNVNRVNIITVGVFEILGYDYLYFCMVFYGTYINIMYKDYVWVI